MIHRRIVGQNTLSGREQVNDKGFDEPATSSIMQIL
jgi:hypothetical protein